MDSAVRVHETDRLAASQQELLEGDRRAQTRQVFDGLCGFVFRNHQFRFNTLAALRRLGP